MKKSSFGILVISIFVLITLLGILYIHYKNDKFIKLSPAVIWVLEDGVQKYIVNDKVMLENMYIPLIALDDLDMFVDFDEDEQMVVITDGYAIKNINLTELDDNSVLKYGNDIFIKYDYLCDVFNLDASYNKSSGMLFVKNSDKTIFVNSIKKSAYLKVNSGDYNIRKLKIGEVVSIISLNDKFANVITSKYENGKIPLEALNKDDLDRYDSFCNNPPVKYIRRIRGDNNIEGKIFLIWDVPRKNEDLFIESNNSVKVIVSSTAYKLSDELGNLAGKISDTHIEHLRSREYLCWPIVTNDFNPEMTHKFLNSIVARKTFIQKLEKEWLERGYDGINIDFENIFKQDKIKFSQFIAELGAMCQKNGIILSVDVTVMGGSDNWSKCYDRKVLGRIVDYMAVMTYDEHWSTSPISGSVASYEWAKKSMIKISKDVPSSKLLLGVPYYMRVWTEMPSKVNTMMENDSKVLTMKHADAYIKKHELNLIWDENLRQYYSAIIKDNVLTRVWFEDERSIIEKVDLVKELNLSGVAIWRHGFEKEGINEIVIKRLKSIE